MNYEEYMLHYGVKGMRWGVRRFQPYDKGSGPKGKFIGKKSKGSSGQNEDKKPNIIKRGFNRVKEEHQSLKRERDWTKVIKDVNKLSAAEVNAISQRIMKENEYKRLMNTKDASDPFNPKNKRLTITGLKDKSLASKEDKAIYRNRAKLSDEELNVALGNMRAKANLHRAVNEATRDQVKFGEKITSIAEPLVMNYVTKGKITPGDILKATTNTKDAKNKARQDMNKAIIDRYAKKFKQ